MEHVTKNRVVPVVALLAGVLFAEIPQWWLDRGVVNTNMAPNDHAPVNQGQAKQIAYKAYLEFEQKFGRASTSISNLVAGFSTTNNYLPVNQGQLKYLAAPFYDQLLAAGLTNVWPTGMTNGPYPWSGANSSKDFAIANIGQLKFAFSFDLNVAALDSDGDGLSDMLELRIGTDPAKWDTDGDWLSDGWEVAHGLDALTANRTEDADNDGLNNGEECLLGTNPRSADSDGDGLPDLWEVNSGTDPRINDAAEDPDGDGLTNYEEFTAGTNPLNPDTDGDGIPDGFEVHHGMNPLDPLDVWGDLDGDLIPNFYEYIHNGSDPSNPMAVPVPTAVVSTNGHDGTFTNLQEAIDAVATNEYPIVFIEPGNYSITGTTGIVLTNADILIYAVPNSVVLDGGGSNRIFNVISGRPIIAGLTLQNGYSADDGGAMYISGATPVVKNCLFQSNKAAGSGGAIYADSDATEVFNCVFKDNAADGNYGGAVYCVTSGTELKNCTWIGNRAQLLGGAVYGGSVMNGIIWSNSLVSQYDGNSQIYGATVSYSCVEGGYEGAYNITDDPRLVQGWHLASADSPCVNSGNSTNAAKFDLDGEQRDLLPDIGADEWVDSDADGLPDWWEKKWFGNLNTVTDGNLPADDSDGRLSYIQKYLYELNPNSGDYDGDGLSDYDEIYIYKTNPLATNSLHFPSGYVIEPAAYNWIDISKTGQAITTFDNMDDGTALIPLGILFPFFDANYDTAYVCNNGFISFGESPTEYGIESLPTTLIPAKTICVFWDDLRLAENPDAAVYIQTVSNQCIISYEGIPFYADGMARLSFQIILRTDGNILCQYKNISSDGTLPTIGTQWGDGNVEFHGSIASGTALVFHDSDLPLAALDPQEDSDQDGFINLYEYAWGTDPRNDESVPTPTGYVSLSGSHTPPFSSWETAATNIQSALDAATNDYDIIMLADGVYTGTGNTELDFRGKKLMLRSVGGPSACIVDGEQSHRGFIFKTGETSETVLWGVCISNAVSPGNGGGLFCSNASPVVMNCNFDSNLAANHGGGVYAESSSMILSHCEFESNCATNGSAVFLCGGSPLVRNCVVMNHTNITSGIFYLRSCTSVVENCLMDHNTSELGAAVFDGGTGRIQNCTIADNAGTGVYGMSNAQLTVRNTILWENSGGALQSDMPADVAFCCAPLIEGSHIVTNAPEFTSSGYQLTPVSPCIDRGTFENAPATDLANSLRWYHPFRYYGADQSIVDIGAYEFSDTDSDGDGIGDAWEIYWFGSLEKNEDNDDDKDGLILADEYRYGTNPLNSDTDSDGLSDGDEKMYGADPLNADTDGDGIPDGIEVHSHRGDPLKYDTDGDGLSDGQEFLIYHTNPYSADTDGDQIPDGWEVQHGLDPTVYSEEHTDSDNDGVCDWEEECLSHTNPSLSDSDGDGFIDSQDMEPLSINYPVLGKPVFNMVATFRGESFSWAEGWGRGYQKLTLRWSDGFWYPRADGLVEGVDVVHAGSSYLHWSGDKFPCTDFFWTHLYKDDCWYRLDNNYFFMENGSWRWIGETPRLWNPPIPHSVCIDLSALSQSEEYMIEDITSYAKANGYWFPSNDTGNVFAKILSEHVGTITDTSYYGTVFSYEYSDPLPPIRFSAEFGTMRAVNYAVYAFTWEDDVHDLPKMQEAKFKFIFNQPVTNKVVKWLTYYNDLYTGTCGEYVVHQCEITGNESAEYLLAASPLGGSMRTLKMIVPIINLNGNFNRDGNVDQKDCALRAATDAVVPLVASYNSTATEPGSGIVPVTAQFDHSLEMPDSTVTLKITGVEPGERFRIWSTNGAAEVSAPRPMAMMAIGGGGSHGPIVDPPLLLDTDSRTEYEWPIGRDRAKYASFPKTLYIECISCGATNDGRAVIELVTEYNGEEICSATLPVQLTKARLIPDWNCDRQIDLADKNESTNNLPFRFWINDDSDKGDIAKDDSDVPGQGNGANCKDSIVNGRSDLADFFPVWLDLGSALVGYPPTNSGVVYKLSQADNALNFVYTSLANTNAGDYLIASNSTCGVARNQNSYNADTIRVASTGTVLNVEFLNRIAANTNKGVLLMEATQESTAPLVLEVLSNKTVLARAELPLSLDGVEKMYRWINLRHVTLEKEARITNTNQPDNYPDNQSNGKQFVFVHGFNVSEKQARAWNSEIFKRLYQSGSRAMYTAVTWQGDEITGFLPLEEPYYHADVINAFQAASNLATAVAALPGQKYVAAHSLGNMVVSAAIRDHGLNPVQYFMIDAAVAMEAYKSSAYEPFDIAEVPWTRYTNRLWASEWYRLFDESDGRNKLSWRGRFGNIPQAINYYSSGEDVLNNNTNHESMALWDTHSSEHSWIFQEKIKGGHLPAILWGIDSQGGWGFNPHYNEYLVFTLPPDKAVLITTNELRTNSFFKPFYLNGLYGSDGSTVASTPDVRAKVLAEAIPATSRATGRNELDVWGAARNIDLMFKKSGWPLERITLKDPDGRWFHSDSKNVAYLYVYKFFDDMAGGLK